MRWRTAKNHRRSVDRKYQRRLYAAKKAARLGLSYSMGTRKMVESLRRYNISMADTEEAFRSFRRKYLGAAASGRTVYHTDGSVTTKFWPGFREDEPQ